MVTRKRKMKKLLKVLTICLLVLAMCVVAAGCNKGNDGGNGGNAGTGDNSGNNGGTQDPTSVIESLTAVESSTTVKVGESILITNFYELKGTSTLNASQRACTYVSSNPDVVAINAKRAEAVAPGTATITITSNVDNTKSCSFEVVVEGVFIDRDAQQIIGKGYVHVDIPEDGGPITEAEFNSQPAMFGSPWVSNDTRMKIVVKFKVEK